MSFVFLPHDSSVSRWRLKLRRRASAWAGSLSKKTLPAASHRLVDTLSFGRSLGASAVVLPTRFCVLRFSRQTLRKSVTGGAV
jgi:hypothetical protein